MTFTETSLVTQKMVRFDHSVKRGIEEYHLFSLPVWLHDQGGRRVEYHREMFCGHRAQR